MLYDVDVGKFDTIAWVRVTPSLWAIVNKSDAGLLCRWLSITEWEVDITAQPPPPSPNDLYCVEWDTVKLYYTIPLGSLTYATDDM